MIAYYVHHVGHGHLRQAMAISAASSEQVAVLSSLPRPTDFIGEWVHLPRDDDEQAQDPTASGVLHWAPLGDSGFRGRMAMIAEWIARRRPAVLVADVSVEITVFARLMGVPVVGVVLPGTRTDPAHQLGYALCEKLIAPWPRSSGDHLSDAVDSWDTKTHYVGAFSRFDGRPRSRSGCGRRSVLVLNGRGGSAIEQADYAAAQSATPSWSWDVVGGDDARWVDDPWPLLLAADVVVTHAGLNAVAEVAAARRPAVVIPQARPHDEQLSTANALAAAGVAVVADTWPTPADWPELLQAATRLDLDRWASWSDGDGARRAAAVIDDLALRSAHSSGRAVPAMKSLIA